MRAWLMKGFTFSILPLEIEDKQIYRGMSIQVNISRPVTYLPLLLSRTSNSVLRKFSEEKLFTLILLLCVF